MFKKIIKNANLRNNFKLNMIKVITDKCESDY